MGGGREEGGGEEGGGRVEGMKEVREEGKGNIISCWKGLYSDDLEVHYLHHLGDQQSHSCQHTAFPCR